MTLVFGLRERYLILVKRLGTGLWILISRAATFAVKQ